MWERQIVATKFICANKIYKQNNTDKQAWGILGEQDLILWERDSNKILIVCANKIFILGQRGY